MNIKKSYASEISNVYSEGARANSNSKIGKTIILIKLDK